MGILGVPSNVLRGPLKPMEVNQIAELEKQVEFAGEWAPKLI
jgi:hypothetical protein